MHTAFIKERGQEPTQNRTPLLATLTIVAETFLEAGNGKTEVKNRYGTNHEASSFHSETMPWSATTTSTSGCTGLWQGSTCQQSSALATNVSGQNFGEIMFYNLRTV